MGTFLVYILKSAVCLAMFYLFYRLLLSKETFHRFNRMALLGVMLLSCLLPLVKVTVEQASPVNAQVMSMEDLLLMYQWNSEAVVVEEGSCPFHWQEGLVLVYFAGLFLSSSVTSGRWDACFISFVTAGVKGWTTVSAWWFTVVNWLLSAGCATS